MKHPVDQHDEKSQNGILTTKQLLATDPRQHVICKASYKLSNGSINKRFIVIEK